MMDKTLENERVNEIVEAVMKVARGDYSVQLELSGRNDELDSLAMSLNMMIDDIRTGQEELRIKDSAIASSINAIALADLEGNLTYVNQSFLELWGYDDKEVQGKAAIEFWQMGEKAAEIIETLRNTGGWKGELLAKRKDGSTFDVQLSASMVANEQGKPIRMMSSFLDITKRKQVEEQLEESERRYRALFDSSLDLLYIHDFEGRFIDANPTALSRLGYNKEEIPSIDFASLLTEDQLPVALEVLQEIQQTGSQKEPTEFKLRRKNGEYVDVETMASIIYRGEKPYAIQGIARDITERKRAEETLQKQTHDLEERLKELNCLYGISKLIEKPGISLEDIAQGAVDLIPPSWQYPQITCARLVLEGREFRTENFRETVLRQTSNIIVHGDQIGTLEVYYLEERPEEYEGPFLNQERSLIDAIAQRLSRVTERNQTEENIRRRNAELAALNAIATAMGQSLDLDEILSGTLGKLLEILEVEAGGILLVKEETKELETVVSRGISKEFLEEAKSVRVGESLPGRVVQSGEPIIMEGVSNEPKLIRMRLTKEGLRSFAAVPLKSKAKVLGVLVVGTLKQRPLAAQEIDLLTSIGNVIAVAIENATLYENILRDRNQSEAILSSLAEGIVMRDSENRIMLVNPAAEQLLDLKTEDVLGKDADNYLGVKKKDSEEVERKEASGEVVAPLNRKIGERVLSINVRPIKTADGQRSGTVCAIRDVTELARIDQMKTEFVSTVSHELRDSPHLY